MLTKKHIAAIELAAQTFESAYKHNSEMGRTVFAHAQLEKAVQLRDVLTHLKEAE